MQKNHLVLLSIVSLVLIIAVGYIILKDSPPEEETKANGSIRYPILFVHGYTCNSGYWEYFKNELAKEGYPTELLYAYTHGNTHDASSGVKEAQAKEIAIWVDDILDETGAEKINIVGHSRGGITSRYYIKFLGGIEKVDVYISLASPHHGNGRKGAKQKADGVDSTFLEKLNNGDETPGGILEDKVGWRDDPVGEGGYNGTHIPGNITYITMSSPVDGRIYPETSCMLEGSIYIGVYCSHSQFVEDENVLRHLKSTFMKQKGEPT